MVSKLYQHTDLDSSYKSNALNSRFISVLTKFSLPLSFFLLLALFSPSKTLAQQSFRVTYPTDSVADKTINYQDSTSLEQKKTELLQEWQSDGYLTAFYSKMGLNEAEMTLGDQYSWAILNIPPDLQHLADDLNEKPISPNDLNSIGSIYVSRLENRGYPFARVEFTNPSILEDQIRLDLKIEKGPRVLFDSLAVRSDVNMGSSFFEAFLNLKEGDPYSEKDVQSIPSRIESLPFVEMTRSPETSFHTDGATTYLYLKQKNANRFSGIVGIQQNENSDRTSIVGQVELSLINALKKGENISFDWQRFQSESQNLEIEFGYPFILKSQIGISGMLDILRQDSTFSSSRGKASVLYQFSGLNRFSGFVERFVTSDLSEIDDIGSSRTTFYGLELDFAKVDRPINPRAGIQVHSQISTGIRQSPDSTDQQVVTSLWRSSINVDGYIPLGTFFSIHLGAKAQTISSESLFDNELSRIGGFSTLRGFDEASVFTTSHVIGTSEFRFDFDDRSNVFLFVDQAWYEKSNTAIETSDTPQGLGLGASLGTNAGIFQLSYALGREMGNPLLIRNAKLHFGFISIF